MNGGFMKLGAVLAGSIAMLVLTCSGAHAVPSFARQLGVGCSECHTIFPELTPFGREFKLKGYTMSKSKESYETMPPLAMMIQASYTQTHTSQPMGTIQTNWATHLFATDNDIVTAPQQVSLFYGGRIYGNLGALIQGTYDGVANQFFLDNTDVRLALTTTVGGKELTYGLTANNGPTVQDLWNTTPAFGFPYASSSVAPGPTADVLMDGGLFQQVGGIGAYLSYNKIFYVEGSVYGTARDGIAWPMGAGTTTTSVVDGAAPYWRAVLQYEDGPQSISLGTMGMVANIFAGGLGGGPSDHFTDVGIDSQYQYIAGKQLITARVGWIHEDQDWHAGFPQGSTSNGSDYLDSFKANVSYLYRSGIGGIGGTIGYFSITGSQDPLLYPQGAFTGSRNGSPDSNGVILEANYLPWEWSKLSVQYTAYTKFNGARFNYDGIGTNASANNTWYLLLWLML